MRHIVRSAVTTALLGGVLTLAGHSVAAAPNVGAKVLGMHSFAPADMLLVQAQPRQPSNRGGNRQGGGDGGGGFGGAMMGIGIATDIVSGIAEAEQERAAAAQEDAIAACARRYRSYDPQTQTYIGRGGKVYNCP